MESNKEVGGNVSGTTISTNTQSKPITKTSEPITNQQTLQKFTNPTSQNTTVSVEDFLARVSQLLEEGKDSKIQGELSFLTSVGLLNITEHHFFSLKMSKAYCPTMKGKLLKESSRLWMKWGIMSNGLCLTANISGCLKIGKECSLSQILEEEVDQKYYLSEKMQKRFKEYLEKKQQ